MTKFSDYFQRWGILLLIACGMCRPVIFFASPSAARGLWDKRFLLITSPLPLLYDQVSFFGYGQATFRVGGKEVVRRSDELFSPFTWSARGVSHGHLIIQIPQGGAPLREFDQLLAKKLFCDSSLLEEFSGKIDSVLLERHLFAPGTAGSPKAEVKCFQP